MLAGKAMRNIRLGTLLGIPILVNPSWFVLLAFVTWLLAAQVYPGFVEDRSAVLYFGMAASTVVVFFASIVLHELGHSVVARAYRIPVRSITLFIFGGVAHITREARRPLPELLMAAAGPLVSIALGGLFLFGFWLAGANDERAFDVMFLWLGLTNLALAIFNLVPAFPMDGGRIFRSILWLVVRDYHSATTTAAWTGRFFAWALIAVGFLALLRVPVYVIDEWWQGIWPVLIGWFLENAARQSLVQAKVIRALDRYRVTDLMTADPPIADAGTSVAALARGVLEINPRISYFVEDRGRLAGIISSYQMMAVPQARWDDVTAGQAMIPSSRLTAVDPEKRLSEVLMEMESADITHVPVVYEGRVLGVVGRDRILGVLRQSGFLRSAQA
jgi:Zn-dependent protease/CBS domain-containing protein